MAWKWSDGTRATCLRALAAWAVYALLSSPNKPGLIIAVQVAEVLLAAIFLAAMAQTLFCPEHIRARHGGDDGDVADGDAAVVLPLVDGQVVPRVVDRGDEPHKAQPAQCTASAPVEADAAEDACAVPVPAAGSHERGDDGGMVECAVCLGEVEDGEMVKQLPLCLHAFHHTCIDVWLRGHSTCPACRCEVFAPSAADEMV